MRSAVTCACGLSNPNPRGWSSADGAIFLDLEYVAIAVWVDDMTYVSKSTSHAPFSTDSALPMTATDHASLVAALLCYRSNR